MMRSLLATAHPSAMLLRGFLLFGLLVSLQHTHAATPDLEPFLKQGTFGDMSLSPDSNHVAATVRLADRTVLAILRRADMRPVAKLSGAKHSVIDGFRWLDSDRVLVSLAEQKGALDTPISTGELYLLHTDGSAPRVLFSRHENGIDPQASGALAPSAQQTAYLIDSLPNDPDRILIGVEEWLGEFPQTRVDRLHLRSGRRTHVTRPPVRSATVRADPSGAPRLAYGVREDHHSLLLHRQADEPRWSVINDESVSGRVEFPLGFSPDGSQAYLQVSDASGPDQVIAWDPASNQRQLVASDPRNDPSEVLRDAAGAVIGVAFLGVERRAVFFDAEHPDARFQAMLERSFADADVYLHAAPADATWRLLEVRGDRDPGTFFLFDVVGREAKFLNRRLPAIDTGKLVKTRVVDITARDGLLLQGFLTQPADLPADQPRALILLPHGGPFGVFDTRSFSTEVQLFAAAGYAVLRVNFRGSGNYGRAFQSAGAAQWGQAMQDDLVDATRWALAEGVASAGRVCIVGASYGAYAALMGVARDPDLYACAVGYVGVYDLQRMAHDNRASGAVSAAWNSDWVGDIGTLSALSPIKLARQIRAPVLLAAGGEDRVAPIEHSEKMAKAIRANGGSVETYFVDTGGHGFYQLEHRREYYRRVLQFLERNLQGGATATETADRDG